MSATQIPIQITDGEEVHSMPRLLFGYRVIRPNKPRWRHLKKSPPREVNVGDWLVSYEEKAVLRKILVVERQAPTTIFWVDAEESFDVIPDFGPLTILGSGQVLNDEGEVIAITKNGKVIWNLESN